MVAELKGPTFGPYHCSNCLMRQPKELKSNCVFCGNWFSNYEDILINEIADTFINDITQEPPPEEIRGSRRHMGILEDAPMMNPKDIDYALKNYKEMRKNESNNDGRD